MIKNFYQSGQWKELRLLALKRDGHRCVECGVSVKGWKKSRVDHIEPVKVRPDLALVLSNLRTLCAVCDNKRHMMDKFGKQPKKVMPVGDDGWPL